jgi:hypothetical protein
MRVSLKTNGLPALSAFLKTVSDVLKMTLNGSGSSKIVGKRFHMLLSPADIVW